MSSIVMVKQTIDLGTSTFENPRQGQYLLSRTTATLVFQNDEKREESRNIDAADLKFIWVTVKRELTVNLRLESSWRFVSSVPAAVNRLVDTMETILTGIGSHLYVSRTSQESYSSADNITVQVSIALSENFGLPGNSLRGKLPRIVRGCLLVEPCPPPEISLGTLSDITIHLKSPISCSPWDMCLTKLWMKEVAQNISMNRYTVSLSNSNKSNWVISLRPRHNLPARTFHGQDSRGKTVECAPNQSLKNNDRCMNYKIDESPDGAWEYGSLLSYSIRSLVLRQTQRRADGISESRGPNSFSLSEIAPLAFSPGYCDNIRYRAGLLPVVTKSIGLLFHKGSSSASGPQVTTVETRLRVLCGRSAIKKTNDILPLVRNTVWKALQTGVYKTRSITLPANSTTVPLADETMLMEEWDPWPESDEEILSSCDDSAPLEEASYDLPSQRQLEYVLKEDINEYEHKSDSAIFEWDDFDHEYEFNSQVHDEDNEPMCSSSSVNLETTSDITIENALYRGTSPLCESVVSFAYSKKPSENSIMEDSTSLPILSTSPSSAISFSFHDVPMTPTSIVDGDNVDFMILDMEHHLNGNTSSVGDFLAI